MKLYLLLCSIVLILSAFIQSNETPENYLIIDNGVFLSTYEVTNKEYSQFLTATKGYDKVQTKIYKEEWMNLKPFKSYYEGFKDTYGILEPNHPVVNIQQEAAKLYCSWITDEYNKNPNGEFKKVLYRLPKQKEWISAKKKYVKQIDVFDNYFVFSLAQPDSTIKANGWSTKDATPEELFNPNSKYAEMLEYLQSDDYEKTFLLCRSNYPETKGNILKHMNTNVSEWLDEPNLAIGLNWHDLNQAEEQELNLPTGSAAFKAVFASPTIGFRVVMEIVEE